MRFLDVLGGVAESVEENLSKSIEQSNEFARDIRLRKIERREAAEDIYKKDLREARDAMDTLSGLTGGDIDKAAQLYKLGGNAAGAQNIAKLVQEEQLKMGDDFSIDKMYEFVESKTKGFGAEDYLTKLVRRPEELISTPSEERVGGVGLYEALFKPDFSKEIQRGVEAAAPLTQVKDVEGLDIQTARLLGTTVAKEYKQQQEMYAQDIASKIIANQTAREALSQKFAFTNAEFRANINGISEDQGIPLNDDGTINIQTAEEQNLNLSQALTDSIEIATNIGKQATGTFKDKGNLATLIGKASVKDANTGNYVINVQNPNRGVKESDKLETGKVYNLKNDDNILMPHLYVGTDFTTTGFVQLY